MPSPTRPQPVSEIKNKTCLVSKVVQTGLYFSRDLGQVLRGPAERAEQPEREHPHLHGHQDPSQLRAGNQPIASSARGHVIQSLCSLSANQIVTAPRTEEVRNIINSSTQNGRRNNFGIFGRRRNNNQRTVEEQFEDTGAGIRLSYSQIQGNCA